MPLTDYDSMFRDLTTTAENESEPPRNRINAARKLLRESDFSARALRVARRIGKLFRDDPNVSDEERKKARSLLDLCKGSIEQDEHVAPDRPQRSRSYVDLSEYEDVCTGISAFDLGASAPNKQMLLLDLGFNLPFVEEDEISDAEVIERLRARLESFRTSKGFRVFCVERVGNETVFDEAVAEANRLLGEKCDFSKPLYFLEGGWFTNLNAHGKQIYQEFKTLLVEQLKLRGLTGEEF